MEAQMDNLHFKTQRVGILDCNEEIVLDSEDEEISGTKGGVNKVESTNCREEKAQLHACSKEFGRLNYVVSEEPGESSQASALDFVDQFLSSNNISSSLGAEVARTARKKLSPISCGKGPQSLAKRIRTGHLVGKTGGFEWADSDQHEGVGFVCKRMKSSDVGGCTRGIVRQKKAVDIDNIDDSRSGSKGGEDSVTLGKDVTTSPHLDSRNALQCQSKKLRIEQVFEMNSEANSSTKPNEHLNAIPAAQVNDCSVEASTPDMSEVGFSTQMAAEAMEALSCAASAYCSAGDAYPGPQKSFVDSSEGVTKSKIQPRGPCLQTAAFSNSEGIARVSKQRSSSARKGTSRLSWKHSNHQELVRDLAITAEMKKTKPLTMGLSGRNIYKNESSAEKSAKLFEQIEEEESKSTRNIKEHENFRSSFSLVENISLGKQEKQGEPHQTEHWIVGDEFKTAKHESASLGNQVNDVTESSIITYRRKRRHLQKKTGDAKDSSIITIGDAKESSIITYRRKRSPLGAKPFEALIGGGECSKLCINESQEARNKKIGQQKQVSIELPALTGFLKLDSWSWPKGKRRHRKLASKSNGPGDQCSPFTADDRKGHHKERLNKKLPKSSFRKELIRLGVPEAKTDFTLKDLRKRRDVAYVRVLFSQHLDDDIIMQQRKILVRLGISIASCLMDATHFIADRFVRTRNMLEAIALSKPVVTHLWLESCGQASCLIDEKNYILRDARKEKEIGFSLPVSLLRSRLHPLLKGQRVLITPNIKPDKATVASLVKAVHGQEAERSQLSAQKVPEDLLILSCEEDHVICLPFLDQGVAVYSSELLLTGIIIQKLEYARYQLFVERVRTSRRIKY